MQMAQQVDRTRTAACGVLELVSKMRAADSQEDALFYGLQARGLVERAAPDFIDRGAEGLMRSLFVCINTALQLFAGVHWTDYHYHAAEGMGEDALLDAMRGAMDANHKLAAVMNILELWRANPDTLAALRRDHPGLDAAVASFTRYWHRAWPLTATLSE